jgi:hypothetical protein
MWFIGTRKTVHDRRRASVRARTAVVYAVLVIALAACSGDSSKAGPDHELGNTAVGIQGCAALFINPDTGFCDPQLSHCPLGTIPKFDEGCIPVGILDCHPDFIDAETGLCDPGIDACPEGSLVLPQEGCVSLDPPDGCGEAPWGHVVETSGDVHVDMTASGSNSDGSRDKPHATIGSALEQVQSGGRIVLAAGDYFEGVTLDKSVGLIGRCVSMVTIHGNSEPGAGQEGFAVQVLRADVEVVVQDVGMRGDGFGLLVMLGARVDARRIHVMDTKSSGIHVIDSGTQLHLEQSRVAGVRSPNFGGLAIYHGASATIHRSNVVDNSTFGVSVLDQGSAVTITSSVIGQTIAVSQGTGADVPGVKIENGGSAAITGTALIENSITGISVRGEQAQATITHSMVTRTGFVDSSVEPPAPASIAGVWVDSGAKVAIAGTSLVRNQDFGVLAKGLGTSLTVEDSLVLRSQPDSHGLFGRGINASDGAQLIVRGTSLVENNRFGLFADSWYEFCPGTTVLLENSLISGTYSNVNGTFGDGASFNECVEVIIKGSNMTNNEGKGLLMVFEDTKATVSESHFARNHDGGAAVFSNAYFGGVGLAIVDNSLFGLQVVNAFGYLRGSVIQGTMSALQGNFDGDGALVVAVSPGNTVFDVEGVVSRDNKRAGLTFSDSAGSVSHSLVAENAYGLVVQGTPTPNVGDGMQYVDNGQDHGPEGGLSVPDSAIQVPFLQENRE